MWQIALLLGDTNTAAELSANATRIAGVVHATYYVPAESTYLDHRQVGIVYFKGHPHMSLQGNTSGVH